jgi:cob(I)alamin adenosyltransferase
VKVVHRKFSPGLLQVYTGDGKGKTTAAVGQGLRAVGRGFTVTMIQFLKGTESGEIRALEALGPHFTVHRFQSTARLFWELNEEERERLREDTRRGFDYARQVLVKNECAVLILDEALGALKHGLISLQELMALIALKPDDMEVIVTGRDLPDELRKRADLVTEMKMIKHPFQAGVPAREGIER